MNTDLMTFDLADVHSDHCTTMEILNSRTPGKNLTPYTILTNYEEAK